MGINVHHKGDLVRVSGVFKDINGTEVDPTTITLKVLDPSGNETSYGYGESPETVERDSTGNFHVDVEADEAGDWFYWWESTGAGQGAEPGQWVVEPTAF